MPTGRRVGTFFNLLGTALLVLFAISGITDLPDFSLLLWGGLCLGLGLLLWTKNPSSPRPPSQRFGLFKRPLFTRKGKKEKKEREEKKEKEEK